MRNSAWYSKIWHKKLQQFPLDRDADSAWAEMKSILDKELPVNPTVAKSPLKSAISKLISPLLTYILPAVAMIAACGYFILKSPAEKKTIKKQKSQYLPLQKRDTLNRSEQNQVSTIDSVTTEAFVHGIAKSILYKSKPVPPVNYNPVSSGLQNPHRISNQKKTEEILLPQLLKSQISAADIFASEHLISPAVPDSGLVPWTPAAIRIIPKNSSYYRKLKQNEKASKLRIRLTKKERRHEIITPTYKYGLEAGINKGSNTNNFYLGLSGSYALNRYWLISTGLQFNTLKQLSGEYSHPSYYRPDSLPPFKVNDSRKVLTVNIPLLMEYKINNSISLQAGPLLSLLIKQSNKQGLVAPMADMRDTVYHSKEINQAINKTTVNQVSIGFTGGLSIHLGRFDLNGRYQLLSPYKISNDLGSYKTTYQTFQFGIGYRFK